MSQYDKYKQQVLEACRRLAGQGYFGTRSGTGGNVSALVEGEEVAVVTPSSRPYDTLTPDDMCVMDLKGRKLDGPYEPSIEAPMHLAVYAHRRDVNAVVHTHPPFASIFAVLNEPIPPLFDEVVAAIGPAVEMVPYGLSGSVELLENVVSKLSNRHHCYLMQNHGALCVGATLEKTIHFTELLEKTAAIYYRALATGKPVVQLPEALANALFGLVTGKQDSEIARKAAR